MKKCVTVIALLLLAVATPAEGQTFDVLIREGMRADIAILDLETLADRATFSEPHQYAEGVEYVLVGGEFVVDGGEVTGALPGVVIGR